MTKKITIEGSEFELSGWANHVGVDGDGEIWEFENNPIPMVTNKSWMDFTFCGRIKMVGYVNPSDNWRNMIYKV